jgi:MOSC domain-containing protein YiiM
MSFEGRVSSIHLARTHGEPLEEAVSARAVAGEGLAGDRYASGSGTYSDDAGAKRQVTLIEIEAIRALQQESGVVLAPGEARRNLVTEDVPLNHLVGREFIVGGSRLRGVKLCEPCGYLQKLLGIDGLVAKLAHRAGLNAEVLTGGEIRPGDRVVPI